ncbi:hypothetical protein BH11PSE13_BH11PSE13_33060 [soil metagenome]
MLRTIVRSVCCVLALWVGLTALAGATPSPSEDKVIQTLIQRVEKKTDMVFVRNGNEYSATDAASHMRSKYDYFKAEIITAEDFIDRCATRSEMTKLAYKVKLAGGAAMRESGEFLREELRNLRQH